MSDIIDDDDLAMPPQGDAGEPPEARLLGTIGGLVVEKMDPLVAVAVGLFDQKRLFVLVEAARVIETKENVPASEIPKLAAAFLTFLETGAVATDKKPALSAVTGGKPGAT